MRPASRLLITSCLALLVTAPGHAADDVYRWVDERGLTQFSDEVPPQYRDEAERFRALPEGPITDPLRDRNTVVRQPHPRLPADFDTLEYPSTPDNDYGEKLRRYYESQACFARFRNANGSVKAEAYEYCKEIPYPTKE